MVAFKKKAGAGNHGEAYRAPRVIQECLSRLLASCGAIKTVELQEKPDLAESPKEPTSKFFTPSQFRLPEDVFHFRSFLLKTGALAPGALLLSPLFRSLMSL
ncbi:hypothetical protein U0070_019198 [Myodes glareolus]|uniref:Uncharacterized protein n=1 Tax=Myodes glareolus TaxID=447135 RepID=A0AAW0H5P6_MYOGA